MARIRPLDAAFEGFRIVRDRPQLILAWTGVYFLSLIAMVLILLLPNLGTLQAATHGGGERGIDELLARFGPGIILVLLMALVLVTVLPGAIFRAVLRPDDRSFAFIKFGADELRMLGVYMIVVLAFSVTSAVYGAAAVFVLSLSGPLEWLAGAVITLGGLALLGWLFVRLCLAGPVAVADEKLDIRKAWRLTRGQFWQLVATLLLSAAFYFAVFTLAAIVSFLIAGMFGGFSLLGELSSPSSAQITRSEAIGSIALIVLQQAIWTLLIVLWFVMFSAAPARALKQLAD